MIIAVEECICRYSFQENERFNCFNSKSSRQCCWRNNCNIKTTNIKIRNKADFPIKRRRKVKRKILEESIDDGYLLKPETEFERQCNLAFDSIISEMKWRFEKLAMVSLDFEFLIGEPLSTAKVEELKKTLKKKITKI